MTENNNLQGLRGWLLLVGFGVVVAPLRIIALVGPGYYGMYVTGSWDVLTTPGTPAYNSLWEPILITELLVNVGLLIVRLYLVYLFFTKKKSFPKWLIGISLFAVTFILLDSLTVTLALPSAPAFDAETKKEFFRSLIAALIVVPYLLLSKRVKATFVN